MNSTARDVKAVSEFSHVSFLRLSVQDFVHAANGSIGFSFPF